MQIMGHALGGSGKLNAPDKIFKHKRTRCLCIENCEAFVKINNEKIYHIELK